MASRVERDPLGEVNVPADAYYGVQTLRAAENFPISGLRAPSDLVEATVRIKKAAALTNAALRRLDREVADAIAAAADEILGGKFRDQFIVDVYQAGAGTSHNMNANEVLANRAGEMLGEPRGSYRRVHPNDHVNMAQSTNDVFPASARLALLAGRDRLVGAARELAASLAGKAREFGDALKTGRTHLQDAVPMTFGQEFGGYAAPGDRGRQDCERLAPAQHGTARWTLGNRVAGGAAGFVDHARQSESVGARNGQPGRLPGDRLRPDHRHRVRGGSARAQRDDAGNRVERDPRVDDPPAGDDRLPLSVRRRHRRGHRPRRRIARAQHGHGNRAQSVHRLRGDGRDCEGVGEDRKDDPRARARARAAR